MNSIKKSEKIKASLHKGFQDGSSKIAQRKCYGYDVAPNGELVINPDEAAVVVWIFERYSAGDSLGKIAVGLEQQGILSPTGKPKWNREAINKMLSNEKYTGRVLLQKTISTGTSQIKNDGIMERYLYTGTHDAIIADELFSTVQLKREEKSSVAKKEFAVWQMF